MKMKMLLAMAFTVTALAPGFPVSASLGGDIASVHDDQMKMQGSLHIDHQGQLHRPRNSSPAIGITVREYALLSGAVFAVTWQGRTHPDLHQVLGAYYDQFAQAVQAHRAKHHGLGPVVIQLNGLNVQMGGHMGALFGKVYLPQSAPAGMRAEEIR